MNWALMISCFMVVFPQQQVADEISVAEFEQLHSELDPPQAIWRTIPWQTSLVEAQNIAVKENKPLFIWSMDGHPLGCT